MDRKKIVIVGLGLIGGSLAKTLTARTKHRIIGIDADEKVLRRAVECGAVSRRGGAGDLKDADFLYLCMYPKACVDFVREHGAQIGKSCIVTDTCGVKGAICPDLKKLSETYGFRFVGGHPMAGKERNGFSESEDGLFDGASYLLVPCGAPQEAVDALKELALSMGFGGTVVTTPEHHDEMIAFTSQLPHVLACSYVMSPRCPQHDGFSAGSYRDVSRVARINEAMWSELFLENRDALVRELDTLTEHIRQIRDAVDEEDRERLQSLLKQGREVKERLGE